MSIILTTLSRIKRSQRFKGFRNLTHQFYYDSDTVIVHLKNFDTITVDGCHFYMSNQIDSVQRVAGNPWFEGVQPGDVVVDIGANIGAITIPLAKVAKEVYALEPLYHEELQRNVTLNGLSNVTVLPWGIGQECNRRIEFAGREQVCSIVPLQRLKDHIKKPINFLKMDCEGCEWELSPDELQGIRQIRVEFHVRRLHKAQDRALLKQWLNWFKKEKYTVDLTREAIGWNLNPFYSDMCLVRAYKKEWGSYD